MYVSNRVPDHIPGTHSSYIASLGWDNTMDGQDCGVHCLLTDLFGDLKKWLVTSSCVPEIANPHLWIWLWKCMKGSTLWRKTKGQRKWAIGPGTTLPFDARFFFVLGLRRGYMEGSELILFSPFIASHLSWGYAAYRCHFNSFMTSLLTYLFGPTLHPVPEHLPGFGYIIPIYTYDYFLL
jgi:hypothetical protein